MVATLLFAFLFGVLAFARDTAVGQWLHTHFVLKPASWLSQRPERIAAQILTALVFAGFLIGGFELLYMTVDLFLVIGFVDFAMFAELAIVLTLSRPIARVRSAVAFVLKTVARALTKAGSRAARGAVRQRQPQRPRRPTANDDEDRPAWPLARAA